MRKFDKSVVCDGCIVSSLNAPYPFVIPGGRFREFYYWDTFWIVEGLLVSEMHATIKGVIMNMLEAVKTFGFVPNGFRIYYLNRSQPPLLVQMIDRYVNATGDFEFLAESLDLLDKEYDFWMKHRSLTLPNIKGKMSLKDKHVLNLYRGENDIPRPESYIEDFEAAHAISDDPIVHKRYYSNVASGAESGWDFTSRWLSDSRSLRSINVKNIVPVDLNSILYQNEIILSRFHSYVKNNEKSEKYSKAAHDRLEAMEVFFWDSAAGCWFDFNITSMNKRDDNYHISNLSPLWSGAYKKSMFKQPLIQNIFTSLNDPLQLFPGGVPTSLIESAQQWDFPNAWAPHQYYLHAMYLKLYNEENLDYHKEMMHLVRRWINSTFCGLLFEKYDVRKPGYAGFGGEYLVQDGFGWTNGVVLYFLNLYGHELEAPSTCDAFDSFNLYNSKQEKETNDKSTGRFGLKIGLISLSFLLKNLQRILRMPLPKKQAAILKGHQGPVLTVKFNGNNFLQFILSWMGSPWNRSVTIVVATYRSPDNTKFASGGGDKMVLLWDVLAGRIVRKMSGHTHRVNSVAINSESSLVFSASYDATVRVWDLRSNNRQPIQILNEAKDSVSSVCVNDHEILTGTYDIRAGSLKDDNITYNGELLNEYEGHENKTLKIQSVLDNKDAHVVSGSEDGKIRFWELVNANIVNTLEGHHGVVTSIQYHPKDDCLISGGADGTVRMWC
ncbi:Glycoside hydrolase, family 37 domain-containing protein [Rozella allomycis CSF55]|uniref:Trehalase n=1 Tax=Rozella allomycis (strain CSF55) TaxID=988480 RepID=A0A075AZ86_ROZAC|nr:Glycoside hydrolase, family 37 domain-containing protein [Rozella allomycis CSF55]|eukprot:EPZ34027.1 Glycoside hydrolase, family 37 domain-containing protein [Rozella allomycis CSF55]